jgi:hypothetical protein
MKRLRTRSLERPSITLVRTPALTLVEALARHQARLDQDLRDHQIG